MWCISLGLKILFIYLFLKLSILKYIITKVNVYKIKYKLNIKFVWD
jgi:hypothetical protein